MLMTYRQVYIRTVLNLYIQMPDTPHRVNLRDRAVTDRFFDRQIPIDIVETALLLGSARRIFHCPALTPICSLAYFESIVEELLARQSTPCDHPTLRYADGVDDDFDDREPPF